MTQEGGDAADGRHSMLLEWDPRDGISLVTVSELPDCQIHGETLEEAVGQGREARASWIDAARAIGARVPPPRHLDVAWGEAASKPVPAPTR